MTMRLAVGGLCALLLAGLAACATGDAAPPPAGEPTSGPASIGPTPDLHRPGDLGFYQAFNMDGPALRDHYPSLAAGADAATVVVVAQVVDVVLTRVVQGGAPDDEVPHVGLVLRPIEVVDGAVPPELGERLTVEFVGNSHTDDEEIAKLRRRLPAQPGLWFLARTTDGFRPVSKQGLFVQGNNRVESPLTAEGDGDMAAEGRAYGRLSALVRDVRGVR
ncbi:hypothetical protein O7635_33170 [Asanoa sp. WMMD1127]|uniref:hypothetical protein n=1 Tax=Asanoa sp. WMMD1127 TaxID=3016107 RepID=UPI0024160B45|nr:hypothetical protein [Asanoa sp. WMMD1127]MDG4826727.1 hypothetical protein [Asanoa sp. WMMD1127]